MVELASDFHDLAMAVSKSKMKYNTFLKDCFDYSILYFHNLSDESLKVSITCTHILKVVITVDRFCHEIDNTTVSVKGGEGGGVEIVDGNIYDKST